MSELGKRRHWLFWIAAPISLLVVYWFCLRFLFPGYFAPLSPFHPDFYDYASTTTKTFLQLLIDYPRPVAYCAMRIMSFGGIATLIPAEIALALCNILLTVWFARRFLQLSDPPFLLPFLVYAFLLLAHPQFYFEHRHDLPAEVSYLFLLLSFLCWMSWTRSYSRTRGRTALLILALLFAVVFAFAKETFYVAALCLALGRAWLEPARRRAHLSFLSFVLLSEVTSLAWARHFQTLFVSAEASVHSAYHVSVAPADLFPTYGFYLRHLLTPALGLVVFWALWTTRRNKKLLTGELILVLSGIAVLATHAVLPNHRFGQYAWLAAPLVLAPILAGFPDSGRLPQRLFTWAGLAAVTMLAILGPFGYLIRYQSKILQWMTTEDQYGKRFADSLPRLRATPKPARVLVTGLTETAVPWQVPDDVPAEFGSRLYWTVLYPGYVPFRPSSRLSGFANASEVDLQDFDDLAAYDEKGNLLFLEPVSSVDPHIPRPELLVPELHRVMTAARANPRNNVLPLRCAAISVDWGLWPQAQTCLEQAAQAGFDRKDATFQQLAAAARHGLSDRTNSQQHFELLAQPARFVPVDSSGLTYTNLTWHVPAGVPFEIHVDSPDGPTFVATQSSGTARTGKWVRHGTTFYLQNVSNGNPLTRQHTAAILRID